MDSQLGPTIAPKVFAHLSSKSSTSTAQNQNRLSKRELEVLQPIAQGKNNREIAKILYITEGTVRNYVTRILRELELRDRAVPGFARAYFCRTLGKRASKLI